MKIAIECRAALRAPDFNTFSSEKCYPVEMPPHRTHTCSSAGFSEFKSIASRVVSFSRIVGQKGLLKRPTLKRLESQIESIRFHKNRSAFRLWVPEVFVFLCSGIQGCFNEFFRSLIGIEDFNLNFKFWNWFWKVQNFKNLKFFFPMFGIQTFTNFRRISSKNVLDMQISKLNCVSILLKKLSNYHSKVMIPNS